MSEQRSDWRARIEDNLAHVRARIAAAGGDDRRPRIVAVTKGFSEDVCVAAAELGLTYLGENYAAELLAKKAALEKKGAPECSWHYLGAIQRRHLAPLISHVACFEGLDRREEGEALVRLSSTAAVYIEVATTPVAGRPGVPPGEVEALAGDLVGLGLDVRGLMTVAVPGDPDRARAGFVAVAALARSLGLSECSMGMSEDYEEAVAAGATSVRLGRALFGPRPAGAGLPQ